MTEQMGTEFEVPEFHVYSWKKYQWTIKKHAESGLHVGPN